jgi:hypothetical protein
VDLGGREKSREFLDGYSDPSIYNKLMKKVEVNVTQSFKEAYEWNLRFWQNKTAGDRFSAAWLMIKDWYKMKGKRGSLPRLRRSVQNIQRSQD